MATYKPDRGFKLGSTEKQLQLGDQSVGLEPDTFVFPVRRPNHSTMLPRIVVQSSYKVPPRSLQK